MYHTFYRLHTDPFRLTPDPAFCFRHRRYARALAYMQYALQQGEGFIMVTGLPGTGKTTLIERFHAELNGTSTLVAKLTSTQLQADELLRLICLSLGVSTEAQDKASVLHRLREFFVQQAGKGRRTLLMIDEAQDLPVEALEELRLLGNLQLNARPLLQIFLVGQQQLLDMVRLPAMKPLFQRLVAACHLEPLTLAETRAYIEYRLQRAGWNGDSPFDERTYRMIHRFSEGFPRQVNKVCGRLLLYGSTEKKPALDCFDCLNVLRHLVEELPHSTGEHSLEACVDVLNEPWSAPSQQDDAADAKADALPPIARHEQPAASELQAPPQGTAAVEPKTETVQPNPDDGQRAAPYLDAAAATQVAVMPEPLDAVGATVNGELAVVGAIPWYTGNGLQPAAARNRVRSRPGRQASQSMTATGRLHDRVARRAAAPLGLLMALFAGLLLVSGEEERAGIEIDNAAGRVIEPDLPGSMVVARLPGSAALSEAQSRDDRATAALPAPAAAQSEASSPSASQAAEPAGESPRSGADGVAPVAFVADEPQPDRRRVDADRSAEVGETASLETAAVVPPTGQGDSTAQNMEPTAAGEGQGEASVPLTAAQPLAVTPPPTLEEAVPDESAPVLKEAVPDESAPVLVARQPEPADPESLRIERLMASAERAFSANRLTVPRGNSAWDYYRQVLETVPKHGGAGAGMQRIAQRYASLIEGALAVDDTAKARTYVARGLMVSPGNRELLTLKQEVTAHASRLEAQRVLAAAEAETRPAPAPPAQQRAASFLDKLKVFFSNPVPRDMP